MFDCCIPQIPLETGSKLATFFGGRTESIEEFFLYLPSSADPEAVFLFRIISIIFCVMQMMARGKKKKTRFHFPLPSTPSFFLLKEN